jgi:hypothetical protein
MANRHPRAWIWLLAVLVLTSFYWAFDLGRLHAGVPDPLDDVWEYGVDARHLLLGDGFRTSVIHPPLWGLRDAALTVPVLVHGPVLPLVFAPVLLVFGAGALDQTAWLAALLALLTALLLYRLGTRHFGPAAGAAAALLFTFSPLTLRAVHHDLSPVTGAFLLLLVFDLLARDHPRHTLAAVVLALGLLVRAEMALALVGLSLVAGGTGTVVLLLGIAAVCGAWWWHNWVATGSPFFNLSAYLILGHSSRWPWLDVLRDFSVTPAEWPRVFARLAPELPRKAQAYLPHALKRALMTPSGLTGWLAALGCVVGVARASTRWVALAAFACALVPVAVMSFTYYDWRYLVPFLPLWALSAAIAAEWLWGRLQRVGRTPLWVAVILLLMLPATVSTLRQEARAARGLAAQLATERAALASRVTPAARLPRLTSLGLEAPAATLRAAPRLMFSDMPDFVAWTTGRPTVWMTSSEYARLPAPAPALTSASRGSRQATGSPAAPAGHAARAGSLPPRGTDADTWFHAWPR